MAGINALNGRQGLGGEQEDSVGVLAGESVREYLANLVAVLASEGAFAQVPISLLFVAWRVRVGGGGGAVNESAAFVFACVLVCERASEREGADQDVLPGVRTQCHVIWCQHAQGMWEDTWRILNAFTPSLNLDRGSDGSLPLPLCPFGLPSAFCLASPFCLSPCCTALILPLALSLVFSLPCAGALARTCRALLHESPATARPTVCFFVLCNVRHR